MTFRMARLPCGMRYLCNNVLHKFLIWVRRRKSSIHGRNSVLAQAQFVIQLSGDFESALDNIRRQRPSVDFCQRIFGLHTFQIDHR